MRNQLKIAQQQLIACHNATMVVNAFQTGGISADTVTKLYAQVIPEKSHHSLLGNHPFFNRKSVEIMILCATIPTSVTELVQSRRTQGRRSHE